MQFLLAQVGASLCWQWNIRNGCSLCFRAEQHNVDGLGRGGGEGVSQKGLLNLWGII